MIRILIGMSGAGKTYKLKEEISHKQFDGISNAKQVYVIEREENQEYSNIFNGKFVHVLKPSSDISFLEEIENSEIYIDCECYNDEFIKKIADIVKKARTHNNDITITYLEIWDDLSGNERAIFSNADKILLGRCGSVSEVKAEEMFGIKNSPIISKYDFREIKAKRNDYV